MGNSYTIVVNKLTFGSKVCSNNPSLCVKFQSSNLNRSLIKFSNSTKFKESVLSLKKILNFFSIFISKAFYKLVIAYS